MFEMPVPYSEDLQNMENNVYSHDNDGTFSFHSYLNGTFNENDARIVTLSSDRERVATLELDQFIDAIVKPGYSKEARHIQNILLKMSKALTNVKVYLVGEFIIDAVVAGQSAPGKWIILQTQLFES